MKNTWKRIAAGALSIVTVAGFTPANVGGFLTRGKGIVANAGDLAHFNTTNSGATIWTDPENPGGSIIGEIPEIKKGDVFYADRKLAFTGATVSGYFSEDLNAYVYNVIKVTAESEVTAVHEADYEYRTTEDGAKLQRFDKGIVGNDKTVESNWEIVAVLDIDANVVYNIEYTPVLKNGKNEVIEDALITYATQGSLSYSTEKPSELGAYTAQAAVKINNVNYYLHKDFDIIPKNIQLCTINATPDDYVYDGNEVTPEIEVKDGDIILKPDEDYTVTIEKQTNAGKYTITVNGIGNYSGTSSDTWEIGRANMGELTIEGIESKIYDGKAEEYVLNGAPESSSYRYAYYKGNRAIGSDAPKDAGSYRVIITASNPNYNNKSASYDFTIEKRSVTLTPDEGQSIIYGTEETPVIAYEFEKAADDDEDGVFDGNTGAVEEDADFAGALTISNFDYDYYINNAGQYRYIIDPEYVNINYDPIIGGTAEFTIVPKQLTKDMFDVDDPGYIFDTHRRPAPSFYIDDGTFKDSDRTEKLTYADFEQGGTEHAALPGIYTLEFYGQRNYTGSVTFDWEIQPIRDYSVSLTVENKIYDGKQIEPASYVYKAGDKTKTPVSTPSAVTSYTYYKYDGVSAVTEEYVNGLTALSGAPKDAGNYIVKASSKAEHGYALDDVYKTFTINKKEVAVTANATSKVFGDSDPDFTDITFDENALVEGETLTISGEYALKNYERNVGVYDVILGTLEPSSQNYYLTISGKFTVTQKKINDNNITVIKKAETDSDGWAYPFDSVKITDILYGEEAELEPAVFDEKGNYISGDYQVLSVTKTRKLGDFSIQIKGFGNYTGFGEAVVEVIGGNCYVAVKNGTLNNGNTSDYYKDNSIVAVTADAAAEGYKFGYWKRNGVTISYNPTYTFYASSGKIELEAVYLEDTDDIEKYGNAKIESVTPDKENGKLMFVSILNVPEDCKIIRAGIVSTSDAEKGKNLTVENADYVRSDVTDKHNYRYTWTKTSVTADQTWYVKGYLLYEDANGNRKTVYSDLTKSTLEGSETIIEDKIVGTAVIESVTPLPDEQKLRFAAMLNVPADCTINKAGIVATSDAEKGKNLTVENADYVRADATTKHGYRYTWTKTNVTADQTWYVRPYLVYTDANGKKFTVYGDIATGKLN